MDKTNFKKDNIPFTQVANEILNDGHLSAKAKGLYAYLYSKPNGWDFALDRIATDFKDGRKSIFSGIKELEANGYLLRQKQPTGRTVYLLKSQLTKMDNWVEKPVDPFGKVPKRQSAEKGSISNKDTKVIKIINNKEVYSDSFLEFWSAYPNRKAKYQAWKIWQKMKPDLAVVLEALENHKQTDQWQKDNGQFIPHPSTWLNQRRWEDEVEVNKPVIL